MLILNMILRNKNASILYREKRKRKVLTPNNQIVFLMWVLLLITGYSFGGMTGLGIAALFIIFVQVLL